MDLHRILLGGVRGESKDPGSLRRIQNWIGRPGCDILDATFVPTEPSKIEPLLENLFVYLPGNGKSSLVKMGLAHYQFEAIHPFRDGNGRIGRLLITLSLIKQGVLSLPLLYLSAYFEKNREAYYASLLDVSQNGNYEGWLKFFLKGVIIQSGDAVVRIRRLMAYHEECRQLVKRETNSTNALLAMDNLFVNPFTTIPHTAKLLSKPYPTARNAIENLQKLGIVEEVSGQKRGKVYLAKRIINSIEG